MAPVLLSVAVSSVSHEAEQWRRDDEDEHLLATEGCFLQTSYRKSRKKNNRSRNVNATYKNTASLPAPLVLVSFSNASSLWDKANSGLLMQGHCSCTMWAAYTTMWVLSPVCMNTLFWWKGGAQVHTLQCMAIKLSLPFLTLLACPRRWLFKHLSARPT